MRSPVTFVSRLRLALFSLALATGSFTTAAPVDEQRLIGAATDSDNWLSHGRDYHEQRFSPLDQINKDNVQQLGLAWSYDMLTKRGLQGTPLVVDGVMYVTGAWSVLYALDARTGQELWRFDPQVSRNDAWKLCCDAVNRGVAIWNNTLFLGALDGRLIAVDAATGQQRWSVQTTDPALAQSITGAPRVVKGKVLIGNAGSEFGTRGYVSAYDAETGAQLWRFYTVPGDPAKGFEDDAMAMAARTWNGEWWKYGGGGTVWDSMAYDPELNLLYIGVGNGAPHNRRIRSPGGGDNLFLSSIVALNPDTGKYVWHYQETPGDTWDYTGTQHIIVATLPWEGQDRKVLLHAPKNGFFFIIDAASGKLLSAENYVPVTWSSGYDLTTGRPTERPGQDYKDSATVFPSSLGGHNWHPMSYSPQTGLVYIPSMVFGMAMEGRDLATLHPRHFNLGYEIGSPPDNILFSDALMRNLQTGYLKAWDPRTQKEVWRVKQKYMINGGVLSTAGGLVFQGAGDQSLRAYDATDGTPLWHFKAGTSIVASPISYRVDGEQYIAVLAGAGGAAWMTAGYETPPNDTGRLLVFKLGATGTLPAPAPLPAIPEPPPLMEASKEDIARARELFSAYCMRCHGPGAVSNGQVPDLRRLEPVWHENFDRVVRQGMMAGAGMPAFDDVLDEADTRRIHAWLIQQAHADKAVREMPTWWRDLQAGAYDLLARGIVWWLYRDGMATDTVPPIVRELPEE